MPRKNRPLVPLQRKRTVSCTKTAYKTEQQALRAVNQRKQNDAVDLGVYFCTECANWHLTSQTPN